MTVTYDHGRDGITIGFPPQRIFGGLFAACGVALVVIAAPMVLSSFGLAALSLALGVGCVILGLSTMGTTTVRFDRAARALTIRTVSPLRETIRSVPFAEITAVTATRDFESDLLLATLTGGEKLTLIDGLTSDRPMIENAAAEITHLLAAAADPLARAA